ncbi:nitroreductase family protein [Bacillus sp. FJAT-47783]|uniref:nitroreductase family protein n=1 Tax=Bacillus sp. FJAT-47783 TaxID=2922712 RepID=UPI001FADED57|nr:nitroreductase family protein [Bacillus sp. FJAT-47783]
MSTKVVEKNLIQLMEERTSIRQYDPSVKMTEDEVKELLDITTKAPSAWNLQHWHFVVFHHDEAKKRLHPIAYNQSQILDSSVVIGILGDLEANKNIETVYGPLVEQGFIKEEIKETIAGQIQGAYQNKQYARDAAFSNASLAAMQLMLAAKAKGYDTCAIGGFNSELFVKEFNISERYVPVMLISVGKALKPAHKSNRLAVEDVSTWV